MAHRRLWVLVLLVGMSQWIAGCILPSPGADDPVLVELLFPTRIPHGEHAIVAWDLRGGDESLLEHAAVHWSAGNPSLTNTSEIRLKSDVDPVEACKDERIHCGEPTNDFRVILYGAYPVGTHVYYQAHLAWPGGALRSHTAVAVVTPSG